MNDLFSNVKLISEEDYGTRVLCDSCGEDYSFEGQTGGFIFESKAICPKCSDSWMKGIKKYNEERFIRAVCPPEMSFWRFVVEYRGDNSKVKVYCLGE